MTLAQVAVQSGVDLEPLASFIASQLELPSAALADYAAREQTMTDHAREIGAALGLRPPVRADLGMMIEAADSAARSTDRGAAIAGAVVAALRKKAILLPAPATIERAGITGQATARKRVHHALLTGLGPEQLAALDALLALDPEPGFTRLTKLRTIPSGPKPDHVREIIIKLGLVRAGGIDLSPLQWPPMLGFQAWRGVSDGTSSGRAFPETFKREAVDRVESSGLSAGRIAAELGLHETVLRR
jgi:hypothetical protein